jgi:hypothetical protein
MVGIAAIGGALAAVYGVLSFCLGGMFLAGAYFCLRRQMK